MFFAINVAKLIVRIIENWIVICREVQQETRAAQCDGGKYPPAEPGALFV